MAITCPYASATRPEPLMHPVARYSITVVIYGEIIILYRNKCFPLDHSPKYPVTGVSSGNTGDVNVYFYETLPMY